MIIQGLLELLFKIFSLLTSVIDIPELPSSIDSTFTQVFSFIETGLGILGNFMPLDYFAVLLGIIIAVDIGISVYHFVMWIIRKIPVAAID